MGKITKVILGVAIFTGVAIQSDAQTLREFMNNAQRSLGGGNSKNKSNGLSQTDITNGLREALNVGAKNATSKLAVTNGFFGNALVKVLMPPEAKKVENTLREIGMGSYVDKAILAMNRAAEDASTQALPIFLNAVKGMSIQDGVSILKGSNDAATQYLKSKTSAQLTSAFKPVISASLDKVNATKYWAEVFNIYNKLPTTFNKVNPDLAGYVTERALSGVFLYIAEEETKIRQNPAAQVTDLLKKVFGKH